MQLPWFLTNPDPKIYLSNNYVVIDYETTNTEKGSALCDANRIVLYTWSCGSAHRDYERGAGVRFQYVDEGHGRTPEAYRRAIESADFVVAHNAKFELQWLQREGIDTSKLLVYDTMIGEFVLLGNTRKPLDLDSVAKRYDQPTKNNLIKAMMTAGVCPSTMPQKLLVMYGTGDTSTTEQIFLAQRAALDQLNLLPVLYTRCLLTPVLADMERNGMNLDPERVNDEYKRSYEAHREAESRLLREYPNVNFNSPKQLAELLYDKLGFDEPTKYDGSPDRTAGGGRRTGKEYLDSLEPRTEAQSKFKESIKELRKATNALMYLKKMKACVDAGDLLYAGYNQTVARNHRLSSSGKKYKLQFHNFPREYKRLFKARHPGWFVAEGDGMQLEFRAGADITRDPVALGDIRGHVDVHRNTAAVYTGKAKPNTPGTSKVTKLERQEWKPETFRPMYGSKGQTPTQKKYAEYFQTRYKTMYDTQMGWVHKALKTKELVTPWGLRFYFPDIKMTRSGYIKHTTDIFNYPISSFATAEWIPITVVFTWHRMKQAKMLGFLTNTVHDSVEAELPEYERDVFTDLCKHSFTTDVIDYVGKVYDYRIVVPLGVELKYGTNWGEHDGGEVVYEWDSELKQELAV